MLKTIEYKSENDRILRSSRRMTGWASNVKYLIIIPALIFGLFTFNLRFAHAQSLSLSISPPILEVMIKPDKSITQVFKISNEGESAIVIPSILGMTENGLDDDPGFVPEKWISLLNTDAEFGKPFLFEGKTQKQLIVKINPPADTTQKNYYRALVLSTKPNPAGETTQSQVAQNLGVPILISVTSTGLATKEATLSQFHVPKIHDSFDTLIIDIDIKNIGSTYFRPIGKITLSGIVGRGTYEISPQVVLTEQSRKLNTQYSAAGSQDHTLILPGFYLGKYEVAADLTLDESNAKYSQKKVFYALPWKAGAAICLLVLVIRLPRLLKLLRRKKGAE